MSPFPFLRDTAAVSQPPCLMPPSHQRMWAEVFEKFTEVEGVDLVADVLWVRGYL